MKLHSVVDLFPPMSPSEKEVLRNDISQKGVRMPIVVWRGKIIDGRNRYEACKHIGLDDYPVEEFDGSEEEMLAHVVSLNMSRRQLNSGQKAAVGVELGVYRSKLGDGAKTGDNGKRVIELIAEELGTNRQYLYDAEKLRDKDADLFNQVRLGEITLSAATKALTKMEDDVDEVEETKPPSGSGSSINHKGDDVPAQFSPAFAERENFKYAIEMIKEAAVVVSDIAARGVGSAHLDVGEITSYVSSMVRSLEESMPHAVCPYCQGAGCEACKDIGWVNKQLYSDAPKELKE